MNLTGRRLAGALVFILCLAANITGAQAKTITVFLPVISPLPTSVQGSVLFSTPFRITMQAVLVPDTPALDARCDNDNQGNCSIGILYGFLDESGNDISKQVDAGDEPGSYGGYYGQTRFLPTNAPTWRDFIGTINKDFSNWSPWTAHAGLALDYYKLIMEKYKAKSVCLKVGFGPGTAAPPAGFPQLSNCIPLPPANTTCDLTPKAINFSYGILNRTSAAGTILSQDLNVKCTGGDVVFSVTLSTGTDEINLSNGMTAKLSANGHKLGQYEKVSQGKNKTIKISSTLSGTPDSSGPFSGSAALISEYF